MNIMPNVFYARKASALALLVSLLLVACSALPDNAGSRNEENQPNDDVVKPQTPRDILVVSYQALENQESYRYEVDFAMGSPQRGLDYPIYEINMDADIQGADRIRGTFTVKDSLFGFGTPNETEFISIGNTHYIINPETGEWAKTGEQTETMESPDELVDISSIPEEKFTLVGMEELDGVETYHIEIDATEFLMQEEIHQGKLDYWVGEKDGLIRQIKATFLTDTNMGFIQDTSVSLDYRLSEFGKRYNIKPPKLPKLQRGVLWFEQFGTRQHDTVNDLKVDKDGSIYIAGYAEGQLPTMSVEFSSTGSYVRKYSPEGEELWTSHMESIEDRSVEGSTAISLALDEEGNVYVGGAVSPLVPGSSTIYVTKYDSFGNEIWASVPEDFGYEFTDIEVDSQANVYGVGNFGGDILVRKYDSSGKESWTRGFEEDDLLGRIYSLAIDKSDNLYVIGHYNLYLEKPPVSNVIHSFIRKYGGDGNEQWTLKLSDKDMDGIIDLAIDGENNLYYLSFSRQESDHFGRDYFIGKLHENGGEFWTQKFDIDEPVELNKLIIDDDGNLVIFGKPSWRHLLGTEDPSNIPDVVQFRFDSEGKGPNNKTFPDITEPRQNLEIRGYEIAEDSSTYIFGSTNSSLGGNINSGGGDALIVKFAPR